VTLRKQKKIEENETLTDIAPYGNHDVDVIGPYYSIYAIYHVGYKQPSNDGKGRDIASTPMPRKRDKHKGGCNESADG
jgi:hypothetical protein